MPACWGVQTAAKRRHNKKMRRALLIDPQNDSSPLPPLFLSISLSLSFCLLFLLLISFFFSIHFKRVLMLTDAGGAEMEHAGDVVAITVTGSLFQIDVSENVSGKFGRCRLTPPTRGWFGERAGAGGISYRESRPAQRFTGDGN